MVWSSLKSEVSCSTDFFSKQWDAAFVITITQSDFLIHLIPKARVEIAQIRPNQLLTDLLARLFLAS